MEFHHYLMSSQPIVLGSGSKEDVVGVGTYQLKLCGETSYFFMIVSMRMGCGAPLYLIFL